MAISNFLQTALDLIPTKIPNILGSNRDLFSMPTQKQDITTQSDISSTLLSTTSQPISSDLFNTTDRAVDILHPYILGQHFDI